MDLWAASLEPSRLVPCLQRLGIVGAQEEPEVLQEDGLVDQVSWASAVGVASLIEPDSRRFAVELSFELDPVLYGHLRELALRDPRLVTALGEGGATLTAKVGWLFTADLTVASVSVLSMKVGSLAFSMANERPPWAFPLLRRLAGRVGRVDWQEPVGPLARRLLDASLSHHPGHRAGVARVRAALQAPPFELAGLELVQEGGLVVPCFGSDLVRLRQLGPGALRALRLAEAVGLRSPDVLLLEEPVSEAERAWLMQAIDGEDATLEQVLLVGAA